MNTIRLFPQLFKETVARFADKTAIVDRDGLRATTYRELDDLSGRVCTALLKMGVQKGDIVPVVLGREMECAAAEIGVLKAGAAFTALSREYPAARVEHIKKDCGASFVIDDGFMKRVRNEPVSSGMQMSLQDAAFAIYTSGSTGNPKGILHTHKSMGAVIERYIHLFQPTPEDEVLSIAPLSFIVMLVDLYFSLALGLTTHILSDETRKSIGGIETYIHQHRPTLAFISPQMLKLLSLENTSMRMVLAGSERVSNMVGESYRLVNAYGSSETAGLAINYMVDRKYNNTPIGKPALGIRIRLVDEEGRDVPAGQEGELCVIGHIASGYVNLPEQTQKAFVPQPDGTTLFRTGDICRMQEDGNLLYINRNDWMVKVNGQRVETGEIEEVLASHPGVDVAVVKGFTNTHGQTYLCAFYTEKAPCDKDALRAFLHGRLPAYMVPQQLVRLDKMPINLNGKLDRKQLQAPDLRSESRTVLPPANEKQAALCAAFGTVLKIQEISIDDDFFELGGDSLQLMMLLTEVPGLTADNVYKGKTPEQIALLWQRTDATCERAGDDVFANLFDNQGRMRILDGMRYYKKTPEENNMPRLIVRLKEAVDEQCLQYAAEKAFERYRVFRLTVVHDDARFYLKENNRKPVVHQDDSSKRYTVCTEENNGHMTRIGYNGCEIIIEMFHGVSDGQGAMPFLRTLLYYYCEKKYGLNDPDVIGRVLAEKPEDPREYASCMLFLTQDSVTAGKRYTCDEAFVIPGEQMTSNIESKYYELRVDAQELESYMRRNDTSQSAIFTLFMNRAIASCHDLNGKPVVAAVAMDARRAYRAEQTMQCCVGTIPVWFDEEIKALPITEQLKRTRQMIWDEAKPENILASALGMRKLNQMLEEKFPRLEEKKAFCRRRNEQAGSRFTYGISYVGEVDLGKGVQEHVADMTAMICANTIPVIVEVIKFGHEYLISYCTHLEDDRYVGRFREMFITEGISCTCERKDNFIETLASF